MARTNLDSPSEYPDILRGQSRRQSPSTPVMQSHRMSGHSRGSANRFHSTHQYRHFDRSCSQSYREQRSGEIRFSISIASPSIPRTRLSSCWLHPNHYPAYAVKPT